MCPTHHDLIDAAGSACLATPFCYLFIPDGLGAPVQVRAADLEARRPVVGADQFASETAELADLSDQGEPDRPVLY